MPIKQTLISETMQQDPPTFNSSLNYLLDNFECRLGREEPTLLPKDADEAVVAFILSVKQLIRTYETKKEKEVKKAFEMFDKDLDGAITQKEFSDVSSRLGYPLTKR